jgi:inactivated superfamily I helicase
LSRFIKESGKFREEGKFLALYSKPAGKKQESILRNALNNSSKPFELEEWERIDEIEDMLEKGNYRKFSEVIR